MGEAIDDGDTPLETVGIVGEWGSGKTSMMHLLCNWLIEKGYKTFWFDPWRYRRREELWTALIREILLKIYKSTPDDSLKKSVWILLKNIGWPTFDESLMIISGAHVASNNIEFTGKSNYIKNPIEQRFFKKLESGFYSVVKEYTGEKGKLIIFIDDVVDCDPEDVINIIESLKLHWVSTQAVVVYSMDEAVVELGVKKKYGPKYTLSTRDYIENQIQLPFFLPPVHFNKIQNYFQNEVSSKDLTPQIWKLLKHGLGRNPRKVKRFVNTFFLTKSNLKRKDIAMKLGVKFDISKEGEKSISTKDLFFYLAKINVIKQSYPDFFDYLHRIPSGWRKYEKIIGAKRKFKLDELKKQGSKTREESKEELLRKYPDLEEFWSDRHLRVLMQQTSGKNFPEPPSAAVLRRLIRFVDIMRL
jgi:hypothetical protein